MDTAAIRAVSSTLFNNDKFIEVIGALATWDRPMFTTQEIATKVGINHGLAKKVIDRLEALDVIKAHERLGGTRGALPFELQPSPTWDALVSLAYAVTTVGT